MTDIKARLKETSDNCLASYEKWSADDKNGKARETLQEAIHELRKVASRLEIELAISERDQLAQKPIPIPPHRDARPRTGNRDGESTDEGINGNTDMPQEQRGGGHGGGGGQGHSRRRLQHRKSSDNGE